MCKWDSFAASNSLQPAFSGFDTDQKEDGVSENCRQVMEIIDSLGLDSNYHDYKRPVLGLAIVCLQLMISYEVVKLPQDEDLESLH